MSSPPLDRPLTDFMKPVHANPFIKANLTTPRKCMEAIVRYGIRSFGSGNYFTWVVPIEGPDIRHAGKKKWEALFDMLYVRFGFDYRVYSVDHYQAYDVLSVVLKHTPDLSDTELIIFIDLLTKKLNEFWIEYRKRRSESITSIFRTRG